MTTELKTVITDLNESFIEFKKKQDDRVSSIETALARRVPTYKAANDESYGEETEEMKSYFRGQPFERKALTVTDDGQGVTVRADWADRIYSLIRESSPMRSVASITPTDSNETEVLVDRGEASSDWIAETGTRAATAIDFMTRHKIANAEHYALPSVTQQMLEDSKFDVEVWVQAKVGKRFARQEAAAFINGDGVGKPRGVLNYGTVKEASFTWGADPALYAIGAQYTGTDGGFAVDGTGADALYDLVDSLKAEYQPGASWMMTRAFQNKVRKLKDASGSYLFTPSLQEGVPNRLLGYPIRLAEDMPALAADVVGALFGDFKQAYNITDRTGLAVLRDPYSTPGYVRWYVRRRVGGALTNPEAVKALVMGTEPV